MSESELKMYPKGRATAKIPLGLGPAYMKKGERTLLRTHLVAARKFTPTQFIVPGPYGHLFRLHAMRFAGKEQFASLGDPIPANVFDETHADNFFTFSDLLHGEEVELDVECVGEIHLLRFEAELERTPQLFRMKRIRRHPRFSAVLLGGAAMLEQPGASP
jgi:hypothetical protein